MNVIHYLLWSTWSTHNSVMTLLIFNTCCAETRESRRAFVHTIVWSSWPSQANRVLTFWCALRQCLCVVYVVTITHLVVCGGRGANRSNPKPASVAKCEQRSVGGMINTKSPHATLSLSAADAHTQYHPKIRKQQPRARSAHATRTRIYNGQHMLGALTLRTLAPRTGHTITPHVCVCAKLASVSITKQPRHTRTHTRTLRAFND